MTKFYGAVHVSFAMMRRYTACVSARSTDGVFGSYGWLRIAAELEKQLRTTTSAAPRNAGGVVDAEDVVVVFGCLAVWQKAIDNYHPHGVQFVRLVLKSKKKGTSSKQPPPSAVFAFNIAQAIAITAPNGRYG